MIDPAARRKLMESVKKGYVGGIVWNRRTTHLVSGHQRLGCLDELHKGEDYSLEIDVIDCDEKREKELLVQLNNLSSQGDWDLDRLGDMLPDLDWKAAGFDRLDVEMMFPDRDFSSMFSNTTEPASIKADVETIEKMKQAKKDAYQKGKDQENADFVLHLVFGDAGEMRRARQRAELIGDDPYVDGRTLFANLGADLDQGE